MRRKISNPFREQADSFCFGCHPANLRGLAMEFFEEDEVIVSEWQPSDDFQGFKNLLHGGIQATLMDEIASWFIFAKFNTAGVTSRIEIKYRKPVPTNKGKIRITAKLKEKKKKFIVISTELYDPLNALCATGEVTYFIFSPEEARQKLNYPGQDKF